MDIEKFIEDNKSWLEKFDSTYNTYHSQEHFWYNECEDSHGRVAVDEFTLSYNTFSYWSYRSGITGKLILDYSDFKYITNKLEQYFSIWTHPTRQEMDYYEMIHGYRLPWSEEHPFIIDEIFN